MRNDKSLAGKAQTARRAGKTGVSSTPGVSPPCPSEVFGEGGSTPGVFPAPDG
ncbi:MAG: hypothetical protein HY372_00935 [Candidatus Andersenbacteria bacterium]|nr:hypothetical protein [Candidatus Andersenbacteria bacterium]